MGQVSSLDFRMGFLRIDNKTKENLLIARRVVEKNIEPILDEFYSFVIEYPELKSLFTSPEILTHAREAQKKHWLDNIFAGNFGEDYRKSAYTIAKAHERIALKPEYYIGGYELVMERVFEKLDEEFSPNTLGILFGNKQQILAKKNDIMKAVLKAVVLDIGLVIDVYFEEVQKTNARTLNELANHFEENVGKVVSSVSASAEDMKNISSSMAAAATQSSQQASLVAAAAEEASSNVETVASASEELSSSILEISRQVSESSQVAQNAVAQAQETNIAVEGLNHSVAKISEIIDLINGIADQTNLLALNATIESARAGEAGKGFAVVAGEVKNLAQQTAKATQDIILQISDVKSATDNSVSTIQNIYQTIGSIDDISTAIAAAVEEQGAATAEISRNVQQASAGTQEVTNNIAGVSEASAQNGIAADQVLQSANSLSQQSETLTLEVSNFVESMRSRTKV